MDSSLEALLADAKHYDKPWLRLPMEPVEGFELFTIYRSAPESRRDISDTVDILLALRIGTASTESEKVRAKLALEDRNSLIAKCRGWYVRWHWNERADLYQGWLADRQAVRWAERREQLAEKDWESAQVMIQQAELIEAEIKRQGAGATASITETETSNGQLARIVKARSKTIAPNMKLAIELRDMASRLMRRAAGLDESTTKVVNEHQLLIKPLSPDQWTDVDLERARHVAAKFQQQRFEIVQTPDPATSTPRLTLDAGDGGNGLDATLPPPSALGPEVARGGDNAG